MDRLPIAQPLQIFFIHPKMMAKFMQDRHPDLLDQLIFICGNQFDIFLKNFDFIGHGGRLHMPLCQWNTAVKPQQQVVLPHAHAAKLRSRGTGADFDGHFFQRMAEGFWERA